MADDYADPFQQRQPIQQPGANGGGLNIRSGYSGGQGYGAGGYGSGGTGGAGNMGRSSMSWGGQGGGGGYGNPWGSMGRGYGQGGGMGYSDPWGMSGQQPPQAPLGSFQQVPSRMSGWYGQPGGPGATPQTAAPQAQTNVWQSGDQLGIGTPQQTGAVVNADAPGLQPQPLPAQQAPAFNVGVNTMGGGGGNPYAPSMSGAPASVSYGGGGGYGNPWGGQSGAPNIWGAAGQPGAGAGGNQLPQQMPAYGNPWGQQGGQMGGNGWRQQNQQELQRMQQQGGGGYQGIMGGGSFRQPDGSMRYTQ